MKCYMLTVTHAYQESLCLCPEVVEVAQSAEGIQNLDKKAWQAVEEKEVDGSAGRNLSLRGCSGASFQPWQLVQSIIKTHTAQTHLHDKWEVPLGPTPVMVNESSFLQITGRRSSPAPCLDL